MLYINIQHALLCNTITIYKFNYFLCIKLINKYFQEPELIATYSHSVGHPYGMVHYSSLNKVMFYWTEFKEGHIRRYDQTTNTTLILRNESIPLYEIRLFDNTSQTGK